MKTLIRFITTNVAGGAEHNDRILDVPVITIGRATDQVLHLKDRRARLEHAQIELREDDVHITTGALAGVTVNGRSQREARLVTGDVIEVGANILRVIEPPADADFAITFELSTGATAEHLVAEWSAPVAGLGGWSKRRLSWSLAALVLAAAFALPALTLLHPSVASVVRGSALLPDDGWWLAGPIHSAHSSTAGECESCHVQPFSRVPDEACMACHNASRHVNEPAPAVLGERRCASCHLEHNEPPRLVKRNQRLCADCHVDLPARVPLQAASDFLDAHPEFRISLLMRPEDGTEWRVQHLPMSEAQYAERSNLKFDHQVHLDADGIVTPDGRRVIGCDECHRPEPGGARMLPVTMDEHCSGCHALNFDPDDPAREVPHGDPPGVVQALIEYYSARLLGEDPDDAGQRVRRPGRTLTRSDRDRAAAEARTRALAVAEELFERRACANCHEVTKVDGGELPWHVEPVRLTAFFYPHANFTHASHETEVTSCDGCHRASDSSSARDLLIPDIESCRECHGSGVARRNNASQTPSACIMCHGFHFERKGEYR